MKLESGYVHNTLVCDCTQSQDILTPRNGQGNRLPDFLQQELGIQELFLVKPPKKRGNLSLLNIRSGVSIGRVYQWCQVEVC